jgi:single-strand DNA-binding protein
MKALNQVSLIGNLGTDPEVRYSQSGDCIANLRIATDDGFKDRNTGQWIDRTEWHRVVVYRQPAEIIRDHAKKGDRLFLQGKLATRKWQDQQGNDRYTTEVQVRDVILLGGGRQASDTGGYPEPQAQPRPAAQPEQSTLDDDDIPF